MSVTVPVGDDEGVEGRSVVEPAGMILPEDHRRERHSSRSHRVQRVRPAALPGVLVVEQRYLRGVRLKVAGELMWYSANSLDAVLTPALAVAARDQQVIEIELDGVTQIDSAGLRSLVGAKELGDEVGVDLSVTSASTAAAHLLVISGLAVDFGWPTFSPGDLGPAGS